jgi:hypothetical protein
VKREMAQAQDFGDGIVLHLQGTVEEKDGRLSAWYGDGMYVAQCVARISEYGNGVAFLFGAEASQRSWVERNVKTLMDSVEFQQPQESQDEQQWKQLLSGHKLTYLRSHYSSDYGGSTSSSTREEISLGADGTFHYYFLDTFTIGARGGTGIGRTPDEDNGSWSIESIGAATQLVLKGAKERRYNLAYAGEKVYLNGKHFFRTPLQ